MRRFRSSAAVFAVLILLGGLSGCGGDDDSDGAGEAEEAAADPSGVVRVVGVPVDAVGLGDPTKARSRSNYNVARLFYDSLLRRGASSDEYLPGLASTVEVVDDRTIDIELRSGVTFSDGSPLDAEAVKFSIERNVASANRGLRAEVFSITGVEVTGPLTATIHMKDPVAGIVYTLLAGIETTIVSPTAVRNGVDLDKTPVGAGPFTLESLVPSARMVVVKNPDYFQADDIKVAGLEFIHAPDPVAQANGLRGGQLDLSSVIPYQQAKELADAGGFGVESRLNSAAVWSILFCKSQAPFDDPLVREALNYAVDRTSLNEVLYEGTGEPTTGFFPVDDPLYDDSVEGRFEHDPDKARDLLAEAGHETGLEFGMFVTAGDATRAGEVIQQQLADVGVKLNLTPTQNATTDFYQNARLPALMNPSTLSHGGIWRNYLPGSPFNPCGYDNPELGDALDEVSATDPSDTEGLKEAWAEVDRVFMTDNALQVTLIFQPTSLVWDEARVGGVRVILDALGRPEADLYSVFVKAD